MADEVSREERAEDRRRARRERAEAAGKGKMRAGDPISQRHKTAFRVKSPTWTPHNGKWLVVSEVELPTRGRVEVTSKSGAKRPVKLHRYVGTIRRQGRVLHAYTTEVGE